MARLSNPLAFTPLPVIIVTSITYLALFAALLFVHLTVPPAPSSPPHGVNLTAAWDDLLHITGQFHPYNSRANDDVRKYLLYRVKGILHSNGVEHEMEHGEASYSNNPHWNTANLSPVLVIDDTVSNVTFSETAANASVYFEGTNIIIVIRGSEEDTSPETNFPRVSGFGKNSSSSGGVLVNAHYDSVSTGFGATDDGVGVVTILQLLSYFTTQENWPKKSIVLLLNNGEEDYLNGARAFMRHPISQLPHTFLNLEGAGAGGRAAVFRSTDTEVTKYYQKASHPFGTVISSDGFKRRLIRSETDYIVFNGELGLRGLDVAFLEPRARYHTTEDSARETTLNSVWHMLSASLATVSGLASDTSSAFDGNGKTKDNGKVDAGKGTDAVWFDLFGKSFVTLRLHTMFALCVTLLVVTPIILIVLTVALAKSDKEYLFAGKQYIHSEDDDQAVQINGWRGVFRFPIAFIIATAAVIGLAFLVVRVNPYIVYSSPFAVWSMTLSAWFIVAWFILRGADAMRPSAFQRIYSLIWMFSGGFVILIAVTVGANHYKVAGGYFMVIYFAAIFIALLISYIELFFLPKKGAYVGQFAAYETSQPASDTASRPLTGTTGGQSDDRPVLDDDATETTSLLRGDRQSFRRYGGGRPSNVDGNDHEGRASAKDFGKPYAGEQGWSGKLPSSLWIIQFLLLAPIIIIVVGQIGLLATSALYQTPADGSSVLLVYLVIAALTALILAPLGPFLHRFTCQIPTFLFFVCVGTVIYNLTAFPFSRDHRLKVYFLQHVDCDTGMNTVSLVGLNSYVQKIITEIPSATGQFINCTKPNIQTRKELSQCAWKGLPALVVPKSAAPFSNRTYVDTWLDYSVTRVKDANEASIRVIGRNTRACRVFFDSPVTYLSVDGAASDSRFSTVGDNGSKEVRLWHREWSKPWDVHFKWEGEKNSIFTGRVVCLWSDANTGSIPALEELRHYMPVWSILTKLGDGLVEGAKGFSI
ncbi:endoplasmic reticulum metallopeptidase 1 [Lepidopterella palustris CBS 459.81]|uniref:Peptide hydrolase n=1 Tax=Lepidopterella palustris CBS 459.81 TaxID=1314670 RepID=A0A8E2E2P0_9PEZI|nr:endoplasmic reticulum metallopeptidase 1 [Lepidopterella palustris CBS 459.81]